MALLPNSDLVFKVRRQKPELIAPARPTTHECKFLSDIDDQEALRNHVHVIQFYRNNPTVMKGRDPVKVIRDAIAETLVFYYPLAGRLREGPGRKLVVDCTGEGAVFIEADADVSLSEFGDWLHPPFPCLEELLYEVPGFSGILHSPLLLIQVTRLNCGGFIFALRINHTMSDAAGTSQLMTAISEIARGACIPSVEPVWQRHLLNSRDKPRITCKHHEFKELAPGAKRSIIPHSNMINCCFFFRATEISALRRLVPPHLSKCTSFDLITTCLWRCRTISLQMDPDEEVRMLCIVNARTKLTRPLPDGYYGNAFAYPAAVSTAGKISKNPFGYALELVMKAKSELTEEYLMSVADLMVNKHRPHFTVTAGAHVVSDNRYAGFDEVDYGWGKPKYGGVAKGWFGAFPGVASFFTSFKNSNGEYGVLMPVFLPAQAMNIFVAELDNLLKNHIHPASTAKSNPLISNL